VFSALDGEPNELSIVQVDADIRHAPVHQRTVRCSRVEERLAGHRMMQVHRAADARKDCPDRDGARLVAALGVSLPHRRRVRAGGLKNRQRAHLIGLAHTPRLHALAAHSVAELHRRFQHRNIGAGSCQCHGQRRARDPAADDDHIALGVLRVTAGIVGHGGSFLVMQRCNVTTLQIRCQAMGRPQLHDDVTREALLDAAEHLLAESGPDAVSVRATAVAVDVSTRAVYSVFGSKQALIEGLAGRGFGYLADLVEAVPVSTDALADLVTVGVDGFRRFAIDRPHLFRITFDRVSAEVVRQPPVDAQLQRAFGALRTRIERVLATGLIGPRPPIEIAFMFHSICHGLAANELSRLAPPIGAGFWQMTADMDPQRVWTATLSAFVAGLRNGA